jgi:hypothetical protein
MSWLFSQALVAEYSQESCSDGELSAPSNGSHTQLAYLPPDRMTAFSRLSRFGMTFRPLTADGGEELLMSYLAAFRANPIPQRLEDAIQKTTFGRRCEGPWQMSLPGTYLPKTSAELQSTKQRTTLNRWVTRQDALSFPRKTWVVTTYGADIGYLHTPTATANYAAPSMQKWSGCRAWVKVFGKVTPEDSEYMMDWPIEWTDLKPLEMARFQQWQQQHGDC